MELTAEQRDIVDFPLRHGEILKVVAFAGTGKTTVLEQFARASGYFTWLSINLSSVRLSIVFLQTYIVAQSTRWPGVVKGFDFGISSLIRYAPTK